MTFFIKFFTFSPRLSFLTSKMLPTNSKIKIMAKATAPNLDSRLFSWNVDAGKFILSAIIFLSKDDRFIIPSIVLEKKFTLAGSYTFASKFTNKIIWSTL
jgi:hypothetical protein